MFSYIPKFFCVPDPVLGAKDINLNWPHSHPLHGLQGAQDISTGKSPSKEINAPLEVRGLPPRGGR